MPQIPILLQSHPEIRIHTGHAGQPQRRIRCHSPFAPNDLVETGKRHTRTNRKSRLRNAQRFGKFLEKHLTRVRWGQTGRQLPDTQSLRRRRVVAHGAAPPRSPPARAPGRPAGRADLSCGAGDRHCDRTFHAVVRNRVGRQLVVGSPPAAAVGDVRRADAPGVEAARDRCRSYESADAPTASCKTAQTRIRTAPTALILFLDPKTGSKRLRLKHPDSTLLPGQRHLSCSAHSDHVGVHGLGADSPTGRAAACAPRGAGQGGRTRPGAGGADSAREDRGDGGPQATRSARRAPDAASPASRFPEFQVGAQSYVVVFDVVRSVVRSCQHTDGTSVGR